MKVTLPASAGCVSVIAWLTFPAERSLGFLHASSLKAYKPGPHYSPAIGACLSPYTMH